MGFCSAFTKAEGASWEEKAAEACSSCTKCNGNYPINPDDETASASGNEDFEEAIFHELREMAEADAAGFRVDYQTIDYLRGSLFIQYRAAEKQIETLHNLRMQAFLKGWMEPK